MDITTAVKTYVLAVSLVLLTACSGSDGVFEGNNTANGSNETVSTSDDSVSDDGTTALSDERARFSVSDCGSLPVSTTLSSSTESAPESMTIGQLVSGRVNPESPTNAAHYWNVELERGNYHLVVDTEGEDGSWSNLSIGITDVREAGEVELLAGEKTDYRARFHTYFSVEEARTMVLRVQGYNSAENYVFAIFENETSVPAPFFSKCPAVDLLSLDTTETFDLPQVENSTDYHWYRAPLVSSDYSINTSASQLGDTSCQIQYEFNLVEQFGQSERITLIGSIDKPGPVVTNSVIEFKRRGFEPAWIRVQNNSCELSVEFTLSRSRSS